MCYLPQMLHSGCYLVKTLFNVIYLRCYLVEMLFIGDAI